MKNPINSRKSPLTKPARTSARTYLKYSCRGRLMMIQGRRPNVPNYFDSSINSSVFEYIRLCGYHIPSKMEVNGLVGNKDKYGDVETPIFRPKRVVILSRITRYEFEKIRYKDAAEDQFKAKMQRKRSDYQTLLERHLKHYSCVENMTKLLNENGIETKVVKRPQYTKEVLDWADAVITAGGDGTFLDAASKILTVDMPIIGLNTDPDRSEGQLCLSKEKYSALHFDKVLNLLLNGDFRWKWRQRIRITMSGYHASDNPIELSDQQLHYLEHRYTEHVAENEVCSRPLVSYYEFSVDGSPSVKEKSSGVTVCTGTGSTSWHFHINQLTPESVQDILNIANMEGQCCYPTSDNDYVETVTRAFNNSLIFDPSEPYMGYTVRDPIVSFKYPPLVAKPKGWWLDQECGMPVWCWMVGAHFASMTVP
ncbi:NAKD2-like protein [Mya arenaria]|uniref:NAD(+) kinase n=1 Tax=Mya arenaria TaxID=6604 RepID=A0ABY7FQB1_MYAAR|nr:NAKD2-like protein [Mya arenaria]